MTCRRSPSILPLLLALLLAALSVVSPPAGAAAAPAGSGAASGWPPDPLERRLANWPDWTLPAPLPRPGREDLVWPAWFTGTWEVCSTAGAGSEPPLRWHARFVADGSGGAVADRAFNAGEIGMALLQDALISVRNDPANPNRQVSLLRGDRRLESTVVGRRSSHPDGATFLADELTLQVLHGPDTPRISRIEVLGQWQRLADGSIRGEQWQATYASPAAGLTASADHTLRFSLRLVPLPPGSGPAS